MSKTIFILIIFLVTGCANAQDSFIRAKKWRTIKEVVVTEDQKGKQVQEKKKDFLMDYMSFEAANKLLIESYGSTAPYSYSLADSVLTFSPDSDKKIVWQYKIVTSTVDSLILKRTEIWGEDRALKITATLHFASVAE